MLCEASVKGVNLWCHPLSLRMPHCVSGTNNLSIWHQNLNSFSLRLLIKSETGRKEGHIITFLKGAEVSQLPETLRADWQGVDTWTIQLSYALYGVLCLSLSFETEGREGLSPTVLFRWLQWTSLSLSLSLSLSWEVLGGRFWCQERRGVFFMYSILKFSGAPTLSHYLAWMPLEARHYR